MSAEVVLVIDDEPQIRRVVPQALERDVERVIEASGGREGIEAAAAERPALIVLDLGLPDMSGIEVCREIRHWSSAPIVAEKALRLHEPECAVGDAILRVTAEPCGGARCSDPTLSRASHIGREARVLPLVAAPRLA